MISLMHMVPLGCYQKFPAVLDGSAKWNNASYVWVVKVSTGNALGLVTNTGHSDIVIKCSYFREIMINI